MVIHLSAQAYNRQPINDETGRQHAIQSIINAASESKSIKCDFIQTKYMSMLDEEMQSTGSMYYKYPDCLRWEYKMPYSYIFIINGHEIYIRNNTQTSVIDTKSNKMFREITRIMMCSITASGLKDGNDFDISISETPNEWTVSLTPRKSSIKQVFSLIIMNFDRQQNVVKEIIMTERNGDRTKIQLKNAEINKPINETVFNIN